MSLNLLFFIVITIWFTSEVILTRIKKAGLGKGTTNHDSKTLNKLWLSIGLGLFFGIAVSMTPFGRAALFPHHQIAGLLLIITGLVIRWSAIIKLKKYFTVDVNVSKNQNIIKEGVYKFIRHPAYSGSILSFFGLSLVLSNIYGILVINIPIIYAFLHRIKIEEKVLSAEIGEEYIEYIKHTKKLLPFVY